MAITLGRNLSGRFLWPKATQDASSGTDNNCQNLNIWTPETGDGQKRAVMVWLHGGGFSTGTANDKDYDKEELSRSGDVAVVSVNHRLNINLSRIAYHHDRKRMSILAPDYAY